MSLLDRFRGQKKSAQVAKERLQIIVARERGRSPEDAARDAAEHMKNL